ncbi:hypothetical protein EDB19DRAFT_2044096 [Suillus lakei]|nr:hypothetical protein EDB19DRAFT_2044096 [Suillus lakei]
MAREKVQQNGEMENHLDPPAVDARRTREKDPPHYVYGAHYTAPPGCTLKQAGMKMKTKLLNGGNDPGQLVVVVLPTSRCPPFPHPEGCCTLYILADRVDRVSDGKLIGKLEMSCDELLDHGDQPFVLSFPPVRGINTFFTLEFYILVTISSSLNPRLHDTQMPTMHDSPNTSQPRPSLDLNDALQHFQLHLGISANRTYSLTIINSPLARSARKLTGRCTNAASALSRPSYTGRTN